ncbi:helix-turn-helix domain-containing protein [Pandoraea pneumonica]|uniref:helix-turn-helix domain-containing protein n=1 Tax=Pandoraea pneumonica TaxID=2508299 RepID=UPI003CFA3D52
MERINADNRSPVSGKAGGDERSRSTPAPVNRALTKLGADLALARRRRRLTQASMAERIQTSVATLRRMEHGDARIPIGLIAQAFFVLGEVDKLSHLLDTANDEIGLGLMNEQVPKRVRVKRVKTDSGAL